MNPNLNDSKIGIVFSGGFAKGAYEVGFCKAILEYVDINNIKAVSGASIGAINAYAFVNNKFDYLMDIWRNLEFDSAKEFFIKADKRKIIYKYIEDMIEDIEYTSNIPCYIDYVKVPNIALCYKNVNNEANKVQKGYLKASVAVPRAI